MVCSKCQAERSPAKGGGAASDGVGLSVEGRASRACPERSRRAQPGADARLSTQQGGVGIGSHWAANWPPFFCIRLACDTMRRESDALRLKLLLSPADRAGLARRWCECSWPRARRLSSIIKRQRCRPRIWCASVARKTAARCKAIFRPRKRRGNWSRPRSRPSGVSTSWSRITASGRVRTRPSIACPKNDGIARSP